MAILVLTSTCSSPGVTTLAVGLSLAWPRSVVLADCDPGAHQSILAGFLAGQSANGKGLLRVAEAHRDGRPLRDIIMDQTIPLAAQSEGFSRRLLPGFTRPGSAGLFGGVWPDLADAFDRLDDAEVDVIVDAGRTPNQGLPMPLLERAALSCLVLQTNLRSVMSARIHATQFKEQAQLTTAGRALGLILVGEGEPYGKGEISKSLGIPVAASIARDHTSAQHLSDGRPRPRKFDSSPRAKSLHTTAGTLFRQLQRASARVGS
jgi:hypothetical protein